MYGGSGGNWVDSIELNDSGGGNGLGEYGTDWTIELTEGTIVSSDGDSIVLSDDADGMISFSDGGSIDFSDIERIDW